MAYKNSAARKSAGINLITLTKKIKDSKLKQLLQIIAAEVPVDVISRLDESRFIAATENALKLLARYKNERIVDVFRAEESYDEMVIQVVMPDVPFLLDSLILELNQQDFEILMVSHPSLSLSRDSKGKLTSININDNGGQEKVALVQVTVSKFLDDEDIKELKARINTIMECVEYSVVDWQNMLTSMRKSIKLVQEKYTKQAHLKVDEEEVLFLEWLYNNHFVFLGSYETKAKNGKLQPSNNKLGLVKSKLFPLESIPLDKQYKSKKVMYMRKWEYRSVVHRTAHMDWIIIKKFDDKGECIGSSNYLGFFTSSVYYQSVKNIPLIREKVKYCVGRYGYAPSSHNTKEMITALEQFPRGELLQMDEEELFTTAVGIVSLGLMPRVKAFIRKDTAERFVSCLIFLPRNRFSTAVREKIENLLCNKFDGAISKHYVHINETQQVRLQFVLKTIPYKIPNYTTEEIEEAIKQIIALWSDNLLEELVKLGGRGEAKKLFARYVNSFDSQYRERFSAQEAIVDIKHIENAIAENKVQFCVYNNCDDDKELMHIKIFSINENLALSSLLPIIENLELFALDVATYLVDIPGDAIVYINHFRLKQKNGGVVCNSIDKEMVKETLENIWCNKTEDDSFNSLVIYCGISWRQALLMRSMAKYLKQIKHPHETDYILETLVKNNHITIKLVELFELKFSSGRAVEQQKIDHVAKQIRDRLNAVSSLSEDSVLRSYLSLILAMKRTNFFQKDADGNWKDYISFKIKSAEVAGMPLPKPFMEIFVYSKDFEAIHLRGGKIARGGLRWSDRSEDYRTEVLGLVKAQTPKNSVIVPVGSKGGFLVKSSSWADGREKYMAEGVKCYKKFLSGLLDITDNIVGGKIKYPEQVARYDENDPYLVVAADKGTATFSDFANEISNSYNFWLGDAFASGGSAGYDHKKMGITARGAWVCVERHFHEMGKDIDKESFTVVGIGDMSGDVFGNGMLLSKNIELVAAFNHLHIFVDPNPNAAKSFKERQRLFKLPRSSWSDYNHKLISKGGGVFERSAKEIKISKEMAARFGINEPTLSPNELISRLLQADVDLLWNGGIGTYVKSSRESNDMIGDRANDGLRVNGEEVRAKIIGEGGNLGMTQQGRMEYSRLGGRVNTDFIDNSAGVDCSDHEVNIKIALGSAVEKEKMNLNQRNKLLEKMTDEVSDLVLLDNYKQSQIITMESELGHEQLDMHSWLIKLLSNRGELDRKVENLPNEQEIEQLASRQDKLTRPSIAVLIAYAKNSAYAMLEQHNFARDKFFNKYLLDYFPTDMHSKFEKEIYDHRLKNEIIATVLVNDFINTMGSAYFHTLACDHSFEPGDIIKAFVLVKEIFTIDKYWMAIEDLCGKVPVVAQTKLFRVIQSVIERNVEWLLRSRVNFNNMSKLMKDYQGGVAKLLAHGQKVLISKQAGKFQEDYNSLLELGADEVSINLLLGLKANIYALDKVKLAKDYKVDLTKTSRIYQEIGLDLHLDWMLRTTRKSMSNKYLENIALKAVIEEIEDIYYELAEKELYVAKSGKATACYKDIEPRKLKQYQDFITQLHSPSSNAWSSMLIIAVRKIKEFIGS
jgi:glutamate dehydrogenase